MTRPATIFTTVEERRRLDAAYRLLAKAETVVPQRPRLLNPLSAVGALPRRKSA